MTIVVVTPNPFNLIDGWLPGKSPLKIFRQGNFSKCALLVDVLFKPCKYEVVLKWEDTLVTGLVC